MCLMPGVGAILVPPSEKATSLSKLFKLTLLAQAFIGGLEFAINLWSSGLIDILFALVGYMAVRYSFGFGISQLLCFTMMIGFQAFFAIMNLILYEAHVKVVVGNAWQLSMYQYVSVATVFIYIINSVVAYRIYSELRLALPEDPGHQEGAAFDPYGGLVNPAADGAPAQGDDVYVNPYAQGPPAPAVSASSSTTAAGGFRPFSGTGYRLGQ